VIRQLNREAVLSKIQDFPKCWEAVIRRNGDYIDAYKGFCKMNNFVQYNKDCAELLKPPS
jgi:hypothetical protein